MLKMKLGNKTVYVKMPEQFVDKMFFPWCKQQLSQRPQAIDHIKLFPGLHLGKILGHQMLKH